MGIDNSLWQKEKAFKFSFYYKSSKFDQLTHMNIKINEKKEDSKKKKEKESLRVDADEWAEKEGGTDPVLGDLVVDLRRQIFPETRHHLLLKRWQRVHHCLHPHRLLPHFSLLQKLLNLPSVFGLSLSVDMSKWNTYLTQSNSYISKPTGPHPNNSIFCPCIQYVQIWA